MRVLGRQGGEVPGLTVVKARSISTRVAVNFDVTS